MNLHDIQLTTSATLRFRSFFPRERHLAGHQRALLAMEDDSEVITSSGIPQIAFASQMTRARSHTWVWHTSRYHHP